VTVIQSDCNVQTPSQRTISSLPASSPPRSSSFPFPHLPPVVELRPLCQVKPPPPLAVPAPPAAKPKAKGKGVATFFSKETKEEEARVSSLSLSLSHLSMFVVLRCAPELRIRSYAM
jgi:hypothetical protein